MVNTRFACVAYYTNELEVHKYQKDQNIDSLMSLINYSRNIIQDIFENLERVYKVNSLCNIHIIHST